MMAIPSRHKSLALLGFVLLAQLFTLAVQIKRDSRGRLIRVWSNAAVSPFERGGAYGFGRIRGIWDHYFALQHTSRDNEALRIENDSLKLAISQLESKAAEAERLGALLNFRQAHSQVPMVAARVIGASAGNASRIIEIDRGEHDGIRANMAVITPDGAVGKVIEVYRDTSEVLLLTDREGGAGAVLVESRIQSPVGGTGEPLLTMKYVASDDKVSVGEKVVTSGMDKIFPRDIPVGTVQEVKGGNPFKQIFLLPAAKLDRLEEVMVLLTQAPVKFGSETDSLSSTGSAVGGVTPASPSAHSAPAVKAEKP
jgi:rod shape-determining protein MreC